MISIEKIIVFMGMWNIEKKNTLKFILYSNHEGFLIREKEIVHTHSLYNIVFNNIVLN